MKVRFYCDVPEYKIQGWSLYASETPAPTVIQGHKRIAFDVEFPESVLRRADDAANTRFIGEVADLNKDSPDD